MKKLGWKFWLGAVWIFFNLSLAGWWLLFGLKQAALLDHSLPEALKSQSRMLLSEGIILMISILCGGCFLLYYILEEKRQNQLIRGFFASFSHELKTSITRLRIQVDSILKDPVSEFSKKNLERLNRDSVILELQLENALVISEVDSSSFFKEEIPFDKIIQTLSNQWEEITFSLNQNEVLKGDRRALECIFKNIVQNAVVHGNAKNISFQIERISKGRSKTDSIKIVTSNDGTPFVGKCEELGTLFYRHNSKSGSGVGTYLMKRLSEKMGGTIAFKLDSEQKLSVEFTL